MVTPVKPWKQLVTAAIVRAALLFFLRWFLNVSGSLESCPTATFSWGSSLINDQLHQ